MKILSGSRPFPNFRFRTEEDARKTMESIKLRIPIDPSLIVWPYKKVGEDAVIDKDYIDAPYELCIVEFEAGDNKLVDVKENQ